MMCTFCCINFDLTFASPSKIDGSVMECDWTQEDTHVVTFVQLIANVKWISDDQNMKLLILELCKILWDSVRMAFQLPLPEPILVAIHANSGSKLLHVPICCITKNMLQKISNNNKQQLEVMCVYCLSFFIFLVLFILVWKKMEI